MLRFRIINLYIFLFCCLFLPQAVEAQRITHIFTYPVQFTFRYSIDEPAYSDIPNDMIAVIAEDAVKNPRRISFLLNAEIRAQITTPENENPGAGFFFGKMKVSGFTTFRRFPMATVMMPDRVDFGCHVQGKDSSAVFDLPETKGLKLAGSDSALLEYPLPRLLSAEDSLVLDGVRFYFDQDALVRFHERVTLINDYYAAVAILDSLGKKAEMLDLADISRYPGSFITLEEVNKVLVILKEKKFPVRLGLDSLDPAGFNVKFDRLSRLSFSATMTFRETIKTTDTVISGFSEDTLIRQFLDGMGCYIRWSMLVTERNSSIYQEYLERYFRLNAFGDDREIIRNLVTKMFPGRDADSVLVLISDKINKAYHQRSDELMNNRQFAEAVELLGNAKLFSEADLFLKSKTDDNAIITKAANGIYESYLGVADGAIRNKKNEMARSYVLRAQLYRKAHSAHVTSDSLFNDVFLKLVAGSISACDTLYSSSRYPEALACYRDFEKGFDSLTISSLHRKLEPRMQYCRYRILISEGEKSLAKFDKPEAGRNFFLARQLAVDESYPTDQLLDSLCKLTYPFYLIHLLYAGEYRIWTNHLDLARKFADSIAFVQRTTGAGGSRELSDAVAGYRRKVDELICWNAGESAEVFLLRAQRERELLDFILAASLTDSAVAVAKEFSDCDIPLRGVKDTADKYREVFEYQRMLKEVDVFVSIGKYRDAVNRFLEAESYNRVHEVGRFGVSIVAMFDYIKERAIPDLTHEALLVYVARKDADPSLRYLKLLRLQAYPSESVKEPLEWLGKEFAAKDFAGRPDQNPVLLLDSYNGNDKWMKFFRMAYYKEAARLRDETGSKYFFRKYFPKD
ncbi:MAG: hypothetical protein NTW10_08935 [Bacteroidetes bacterium]|nr:hypothetical protein [Bacteroidota bacterium]